MKRKFFIVLIQCALLLFISCERDSGALNGTRTGSFTAEGSYQGEYWPTQNWRSCQPEDVGMNSAKLQLAYEYAANPKINTEGVIIIKDGYIVGEAYFGDFKIDSRHESYSVAKSFSSCLIGIAIDKGLIPGVNERVYQYFPEWQTGNTQRAKKNITIKHLLNMMGGLQWNEEDYYHDTSANDVFIMGSKYDFIQYVLAKPIVHEPGTYWYYSSGESMLLTGIIEEVADKTAYDFAYENLFEPIGLERVQWLHDPAGHTITAWGVQATVREFAKFGYLYSQKGKWEDKQIVSEKWVTESTAAISDSFDHYACQWWLPPAFYDYEQYDIPKDTFIAVGIYIQLIYVLPSRNLVVVRVGNDAGGPWKTLEFLRIVLDAFN